MAIERLSRIVALCLTTLSPPARLPAAPLAAIARIAGLEGWRVARERPCSRARFGARHRCRCCLWLLDRNAVDIETERTQRLDDGVAVGAQAVIGVVIVDFQLDGK